jgi:tetratricopeptide (TPR) repeat protein
MKRHSSPVSNRKSAAAGAMTATCFVLWSMIAAIICSAGCAVAPAPAPNTTPAASAPQKAYVPSAPVAMTSEQRVQMQAAQRESEISNAKAATARDPLNWRVFNELGVVYYRQAMFDQAVAAFQQALALHPVTTTIEAETRQEEALAAQRAAMEAKRQAAAQRAKEMQSKQEMSELFGMMSSVAGMSGNSSAQMLMPALETLNNQTFSSSIEVPSLPPEMKAESSLKDKREIAGIYANLGSAYFGKKSYPQAVSSFDNVIQLDPSRTEVLKTSAEAQYQLCNYEECITTLTRYHAIAPVEASSLLLLSDSYRALGMEPEADKVFKSFVARQSGVADAAKLMTIGAQCLVHYRYAEALDFLTRAEQAGEVSPDSARRFAEAQLSQYQMTNAISLLLASAHFSLFQTTNAVALLFEAVGSNANSIGWYMLGRGYDELGIRDQAAEAYRKALVGFSAGDKQASVENYLQVCRGWRTFP